MGLYDYITSSSYTDPIMEEIYAIKRKKPEEFSRDSEAYYAAIAHRKAEAASLGLSYLDYCLKKVNDRHPSLTLH